MKQNYSLKEISEWTRDGSEVQIPAIQRGLVWKPKQVEFLWDSIFRGFPIGSFILYRPNKETDKLELMDGQQRYNTISLGFTEEDPKSIVWIDLNPTMGEHSTREFLFRVTTKAHPWGFKSDEDCSRLSSSEIRDALREFGMNEDTNIYKQELRLTETWPVNANKPVPLFMLMHACEDTFDKFRNKLIDIIKKSQFKIYKEKNITEYLENITDLERIWNRIKDIISNYRVPCNELPIEVIQDKVENLEIFFTRINKGGTPISNENLTYASINSYRCAGHRKPSAPPSQIITKIKTHQLTKSKAEQMSLCTNYELQSVEFELKQRMDNLQRCILTIPGLSEANQIDASYNAKIEQYLSEDSELDFYALRCFWGKEISVLLADCLTNNPDADDYLEKLKRALYMTDLYVADQTGTLHLIEAYLEFVPAEDAEYFPEEIELYM